MKFSLLRAVAAGAFLSVASPIAGYAGFQETIDRSTYILQDFQANGPFVPKPLFDRTKGVVVMKITKGALIFGGKDGEGTLNTRTKNGWSGPVAVSTSGASFGLQAGAEISEVVILLTSDRAVNKFLNDSSIKFEGEMKAAAGPAIDASIDYSNLAEVYAYQRTEGAFAGITINGGIFEILRVPTNKYYGKPTSISDILNGRIAVPEGALKLVDTLAIFGKTAKSP
jgi:lipid-binding SYLF domain-containing protein